MGAGYLDTSYIWHYKGLLMKENLSAFCVKCCSLTAF